MANLLKVPLTYASLYFFISSMGSEQFGVLTIGLSYASLLLYILNGGLDKSLVFLMPTSALMRKKVISTALIGLVPGLVCVAAIGGLMTIFPRAIEIDLAIMIVALGYGVLLAGSRTAASALIVCGERRVTSYYETIFVPLILCLGALSMKLLKQDSALTAGLWHIFAAAVGLVVLLSATYKTWRGSEIIPSDWSQAKQLLRLGAPLGVTQILNSGLSAVCITASSYFTLPESIASVSVALRINFLTVLAVTALNPFICTSAAKAFSEGKTQSIKELSSQTNHTLLLWNGLCFILICFFGKEWLSLFTLNDPEAYHTLVLVTLASTISSIASVNFQILTMSGKVRAALLSGLISSLVAAICSVVFGLLFSPLAPAIAYLASMLCLAALREVEIRAALNFTGLNWRWLITFTALSSIVVLIDINDTSMSWRASLAAICALIILGTFGPKTLRIFRDSEQR